LTSPGVGCHLENHLRRAFGHKELFPIRSFDGGFRALVDRIEWHEVQHLAALQFLVVLHTSDDGKVDGVLVFCAGGKRRPQNHLVGCNAVHRERIAQCQFVLRERAGLVGAEHVYPASSSMADRRVTIASFFASNRAPTAMVTDSTVGMATGIAATKSTRQIRAW